MKRSRCVEPVAALIEKNFRRQRKMKFVAGCETCEEIRMKPVKAWAVVRNQRLQGKLTNGLDVTLVMPTKQGAMKYKLTDDRVARVEIREIE